jgi:hypothetical protein
MNRRRAPRGKVPLPVRIRPCDANYPEEICSTRDVSRYGLLFRTAAAHYTAGMDVFVTRNFRPGDPTNCEEIGDVVRVKEMGDGTREIAIRILGKVNLAEPGSF